jgi:hypothetical protein
MKIEVLPIVMRQLSRKKINLRLKLMGMLIAWICLASAQNAEALSTRVQLGLGSDGDFNSYGRVNLDLFLRDDTFAPYISGEIGGSGHDREYCTICKGVINSEYEYRAGVLGMQIKPFENKRVVPYLVVGVIHGTVKYYAWAKDFRDSIASLSRYQASYTAYRGGLGLHIILREKLAFEVELNGTGGVPAAYAVASNGISKENVEMFNGRAIVSIAFGVRYYF